MRTWLLTLTFRRYWQARAVVILVTILDEITDRLDGVVAQFSRKPWGIFEEDSGIHVVPVRDDVEHGLGHLNCICGPKVEWIDPATEETYPAGPLVVHYSLDGREHAEEAAVRSTAR